MMNLTHWITSPGALQEIEAERIRRNFALWLTEVSPTWTWDWPHLAYVQQHLNKLTQGDISRLMIFLPPRHGKSEMTTVRYAAWRLENNPELKVIIGAYSQTLANKFSRKAKRIAGWRMNLLSERMDDWETPQGGGVRAVGVGAGITGQGGDLIIIDDPVKSREEANSETYRERVWDWYTDDLYTRLEPDAAMILIMTRWHEDDLAGRILASDDAPDWTVISLPAEAEENDPLGRRAGEALCPDRYDLEALANRKRVLRNSYYALFQQSPLPAEGGMFKSHWFEVVREFPRKDTRYCRYWDKAGTADDGAYTVGVLMARSKDGVFYVVDVVRGQWSALQREQVIKQTAIEDRELYGHNTVWVEQEPGSGGKESAEATIRNLAGFNIRAERVTGSKEDRAEPYAAQAESENVKLIQASWNQTYKSELAAFPFGTYADQVDASSGAFNKLVTTQPSMAKVQVSGLYSSRSRRR